MKRFISVIAMFVFFFTIVENSRAEEPNGHQRKEAGAAEKIALFPFYNYTGSSSSFLETYLPELIEKKLPTGKYLAVIPQSDIDVSIKKNNVSPKELFSSHDALQIGCELGADFAVTGRYLFEGKTFILQCKVIQISSGRINLSDEYRFSVEDNLLDVAAQSSAKVAEWIKHEFLSEVVFQLEAERVSTLRNLFLKARDSRIGVVFTNKWLFALLIAVGFSLLAFVIKVILEKVVLRLTQKTQTTVDDQIVMISRSPIRWIIVGIGLKIALLPLQLSASVYTALNNVFTAIIIALAGYLFLRISDILIREWGAKVSKKLESRINDDLVPLFTKISRIFIVIITGLLVLAQFGIEITPLVASLGIAGFAIGFAIKDTLANVIGGIILTLDRSFAVGDKVSIDGEVGVVLEVGLRNTLIQTYDNEVIVIPNGELMSKKFKNFALPNPEIRVVVDFGVVYGSDVARVEEVVLEAIKTVSEVKKDPAPEVLFVSMGDFSLNFQARFWIPMFSNQFMKKVEATKKIYNALNAAGIGIPFPTRTVYVKNE